MFPSPNGQLFFFGGSHATGVCRGVVFSVAGSTGFDKLAFTLAIHSGVIFQSHNCLTRLSIDHAFASKKALFRLQITVVNSGLYIFHVYELSLLCIAASASALLSGASASFIFSNHCTKVSAFIVSKLVSFLPLGSRTFLPPSCIIPIWNGHSGLVQAI